MQSFTFSLAYLPFLLSAASEHELLRLTASDSHAGDALGYAVAIDGPRALIGAPLRLEGGAAYVFDVATGQERRVLLGPGTGHNDMFGGAVAVRGSLGLVGAWGVEGRGAAYLYDLDTGELLREVTSDEDGALGLRVALGHERMLVAGAPGPGGTTVVRVFDVTTGAEHPPLSASDGVPGDTFGWSLALEDQRAVVGAPGYVSGGPGAVYVFDLQTGAQRKLVAEDGAADDHFGWSVDVEGRIVLVGAPSVDGSGSSWWGAAYVFDLDLPHGAEQIAKLGLPDDGDWAKAFGESVALHGGLALVAAIADSEQGPSSGAVYAFERSTGALTRKLTASDGGTQHWLGQRALALGGGRVLAGARGFGGNAGAAYLFDLYPEVQEYCGVAQTPHNASHLLIDGAYGNAESIRLSLANGPPGQFAVLLVGDGNATVHAPPGASGDLCVAGGACLGRYSKDVGPIDPGGTFTTDVAQALSRPCGGTVNFSPGSTWSFQYWHRAPMGQLATFSEAIRVTFD